MQIFYRSQARYFLSAILFCLLSAVPARTQTLARPNWAGSGVTVEPWWHRAVFYRLDPATFQDSKNVGYGDLAGITQRLEYLQTLGVDALILRSVSEAKAGGSTLSTPSTLSMDGFDELARAAVGRHLRVLVELGAPASQSADAQYLNAARAWLNQGAAGIYLPTAALQKVDGTTHIALLLHQLRALTDSFPGGRVLLADAPGTQDQDLLRALSKETQLMASVPMGASGDVVKGAQAQPTAASLRAQLTAALGSAPAATDTDAATDAEATQASTKTAPAAQARTRGRRSRHARRQQRSAGPKGASNSLLVAERVPAGADAKAQDALERTLAVMLLDSRSAVMVEYGQELGLEMAGAHAPLMQWTPSNLTRAPKPELPAPKPQKAGPGYHGFRPYVPPLRKDLFAAPKMPVVEESDEAVVVTVDPDSLPGFTAGTFDTALAAPNGETANAALEQNNPGSLLNLYRQLIQLHHENATVRNGTETLLDFDAVNALVWVRRAPASSRTSTTVVAVCNLSDKPVATSDVAGVHVLSLRSLLRPVPVGGLGSVAGYRVLLAEGR